SYPHRAGSLGLLETLGFELGHIPGEPGREPQSTGHYKAPYRRFTDEAGDYMAYVRFHEAWPVRSTSANDPAAQILAYGRDGDLAVALHKRLGKGAVVVIGDTGFALDKN